MEQKTILISPLNWGLGHAVRDIPLIHRLLKEGYKVIIATEGASAQLLKKEFPEVIHLKLESFKINYPKNSAFVLKMLMQIPKILLGIIKEYKQLKKIIKKYNIDLIISDNRYGVYSKEIPSVFISHQIFIQLPKNIKFLEKILFKIQQNKLSKFNKILIPDFSNEPNLSGKLSHKQRLYAKYLYLGILSEFELKENEIQKNIYDILVIISGPEPQRSIFEKTIFEQLKNTSKNVLVILGKPESVFLEENKNIKVVNHLSRSQMQDAILNSKNVISRAGYTTIMDLVKLQKKAILIPTPGQTEQEYLAKYLKNKDLFVFKNQKDFIIDEAVNNLEKLNANFSQLKNAKHDDFISIIKNMFPPNYLDNEKCVTKQERKF